MGTVVIAGASRGIGLRLVEVCAGRGDRVIALCRTPDKADELDRIARASGGAITLGKVDLGDCASIEAAAAEIGDQPVDLLLNVGGIFHAESGPEEDDFSHWREAFEVMCIGPVHMLQVLLPNLEKAKGKVLTVSSQLGASTWPGGGMYSYSAAKAALNRVMRAFAVDLKERGIAVGLVHPGYVQTDMGGPNADITPQESAEGIAAVASRLSLENSGSFWKWNGEVHPW